jgi:hypothetical protein
MSIHSEKAFADEIRAHPDVRGVAKDDAGARANG